jgi:hypothetical protein
MKPCFFYLGAHQNVYLIFANRFDVPRIPECSQDVISKGREENAERDVDN